MSVPLAKREEGIEPDRVPGLPHPRERTALVGHAQAEAALLSGLRTGRLHHAWLIGGPQGIGKATLAYRMARYLLAHGGEAGDARTLAVDPQHPAARQIAALTHPNLAVLRRTPGQDGKGPSTTIPVDAVRRAIGLFESTAANGGYRVCIVDSAEDLTVASANALLKLVEEPPPRSLFLVVAHEPGRVLATIRSRCRRLILPPLSGDEVRTVLTSLGGALPEADAATLGAAVEQSAGSVGRAVERLDRDKAAILREVSELLSALPRLDRKRVLTLADRLSRRDAETAFDLALDTASAWISQQLGAKTALGASHLAPLVEVCDKIASAARDADAYNLDKRPLVLTLFGDLAEAVRRTA